MWRTTGDVHWRKREQRNTKRYGSGVCTICVCGARPLLQRQGVSSSAKQLQWPRTGGLPRHVHVLHEQPTQEVCVMGPQLFDKQPCRRLFSLRRRACSHTPSCPPTQQNLRQNPCSTTPANNKQQPQSLSATPSTAAGARTGFGFLATTHGSRHHMQQQHTRVSAQRTHTTAPPRQTCQAVQRSQLHCGSCTPHTHIY